jgi:hypothetical protein
MQRKASTRNEKNEEKEKDTSASISKIKVIALAAAHTPSIPAQLQRLPQIFGENTPNLVYPTSSYSDADKSERPRSTKKYHSKSSVASRKWRGRNASAG